MAGLAKTLLGFVNRMPDGPHKQELRETLELCPAIDIEVVPEERANKNMKSLRQSALESGQAYVIARAERIEKLPQATFVLSSDTILSLIGSVHDETKRKAAKRRSASALLAQLKPLDASVVNMRLGSLAHEETQGGRGRIF